MATSEARAKLKAAPGAGLLMVSCPPTGRQEWAAQLMAEALGPGSKVDAGHGWIRVTGPPARR